MKYKELIKNSSAGVLLRGSYVALESYFLIILFSNLFGIITTAVTKTRATAYWFWIVDAAADILAVLIAYLVMNAVGNRWNARLRSKMIVAMGILLATVILAALSQLLMLSISRQIFSASFH